MSDLGSLIESESSDNEFASKKAKKKAEKRAREARSSRFLDEAADEGEDESEEESRGRRAASRGSVDVAAGRKVTTIRDIVGRLEKEYADADDGDDDDDVIGEPEEEDDVDYFEAGDDVALGYQAKDAAAAGLYPTISDPKLFMVKVKSGFARMLCTQVMYKCMVRSSKGQDLMIKSVFCRDHLGDYIYIEAHRQSYVVNAIMGLQGVFRSKIKLIPISEMPSTLAKTRKAHDVKPGAWGRFRHGLHKGDLCRIMEIDDNRETFVVHVIPRVDWEKLLNPDAPSTTVAGFRTQKLKARTRPIQRFFTDDDWKRVPQSRGTTIAEYRKLHPDVKEIFVNGRHFTFEGHEIKTVRQSAINTNRKLVNMTTDEHMRFMHGRVPTKQRDIDRLREMREVEYAVGDTIRVVKGELKNTQGIIKEIYEDATGTKYRVLPLNNPLLTEWIPLTKDLFQKVITVGTRVKIVAGAHAGQTGMVVNVMQNMIRVFIDLDQEEFDVFMADVVETQETSLGVPSHGQFEVNELVKLRAGVGMILKIEAGHFLVLTDLGKTIDAKHSDLLEVIASTRQSTTRKGKRQSAMDRFGNEVMQGDIVKVISEKSPWEQKVANVKHVYKDSVWLESPGVRSNMGFFVVRKNDIWLVGGDKKQKSQDISTYDRPAALKGAGDEGDEAKKKVSRKDPNNMAGKRVRITKGYYKGYLGIVVAVHGTQARVEMHTGELNLTVPTDWIRAIGIEDSLATTEQAALRPQTAKTHVPHDVRAVSADRISEVGTNRGSVQDWMSSYSDFSDVGSRGGSLPAARAGVLPRKSPNFEAPTPVGVPPKPSPLYPYPSPADSAVKQEAWVKQEKMEADEGDYKSAKIVKGDPTEAKLEPIEGIPLDLVPEPVAKKPKLEPIEPSPETSQHMYRSPASSMKPASRGGTPQEASPATRASSHGSVAPSDLKPIRGGEWWMVPKAIGELEAEYGSLKKGRRVAIVRHGHSLGRVAVRPLEPEAPETEVPITMLARRLITEECAGESVAILQSPSEAEVPVGTGTFCGFDGDGSNAMVDLPAHGSVEICPVSCIALLHSR